MNSTTNFFFALRNDFGEVFFFPKIQRIECTVFFLQRIARALEGWFSGSGMRCGRVQWFVRALRLEVGQMRPNRLFPPSQNWCGAGRHSASWDRCGEATVDATSATEKYSAYSMHCIFPQGIFDAL